MNSNVLSEVLGGYMAQWSRGSRAQVPAERAEGAKHVCVHPTEAKEIWGLGNTMNC